VWNTEIHGGLKCVERGQRIPRLYKNLRDRLKGLEIDNTPLPLVPLQVLDSFVSNPERDFVWEGDWAWDPIKKGANPEQWRYTKDQNQTLLIWNFFKDYFSRLQEMKGNEVPTKRIIPGEENWQIHNQYKIPNTSFELRFIEKNKPLDQKLIEMHLWQPLGGGVIWYSLDKNYKRIRYDKPCSWARFSTRAGCSRQVP